MTFHGWCGATRRLFGLAKVKRGEILAIRMRAALLEFGLVSSTMVCHVLVYRVTHLDGYNLLLT